MTAPRPSSQFPDSAQPSGSSSSFGLISRFGADSTLGQPGIGALPSDASQAAYSIAWRRRVLLAVAVLGCLGFFLLARLLAHSPTVPAEWRVTPKGQLELSFAEWGPLKDFMGTSLVGLGPIDGPIIAFDSVSLPQSSRWIMSPEERQQQRQARAVATQAVQSGQVLLAFDDGRRLVVPTQARGYLNLGSMFWLLSAFALVLFLVGWIVPLVQPHEGNLLYSVMAHAQSAQLVLAAIAAAPGLAYPPGLIPVDPIAHTILDLITCAAAATATAWHPLRLPGRRWVAVGIGLVTALFCVRLLVGAPLAHDWWWSRGLMLALGLSGVALLSWSHRIEPHPYALVMRRLSLITMTVLGLLALSLSDLTTLPQEVLSVATAGPMIWTVFLSAVILLVPFISRSQQVMREFAMLAGISTIATAVDLLFVAVFSFSQFTSLTLSLFLALGAYAAIRQWLINQMMGARTLTTERMFQHLYRIAREVEARPERAGDRMVELLRNVYEPLEAERIEGQLRQSRVASSGAVLMVPIPNLTGSPTTDGVVVLRFAERGKRLFTPEDARLADRIVEQLMRALAHDRAVERGRSEERARIAQDLHDDIGARLLTLMYKSPSKEMEDYVRHTLQDLKTLTRGLAAKEHPLSLATAEWKTDIGQRLLAARCELEWITRLDDDITLSMTQWSSLTRILRELISNVIAHAHAQRVRVECTLIQGMFTLRIYDDGTGRDPASWSHGLGLGGIRKRVKLLGGRVDWQEQQTLGIVCTVHIPRLAASH